MPELTEQELVKILIYEQDTESFIQRWLKELIDWLNANPVSSFKGLGLCEEENEKR